MYSKLLTGCILLCSHVLAAQNGQHYDRIGEVKKYIQEEYVETINIDSIIDGMVHAYLNDPATIREIFNHLDPHSNYMDEKEYKELKIGLAGNFQGVGLAFTILNDTIIITKIFEGGPAKKGGLLTGDKLIEIDDMPFSGENISYDTVINTLRGEKGTAVKLSVYRNNIPEFMHVNMIRDNISLKSVQVAYMLNKQTGYIKISHFAETTVQEVQFALQKLNAEGMKRLVLDLRDNSGGYFKAATGVADEFLPANTLLVYTEGKPGSREDQYTKKTGLFETGSMVVLVNEATASSGEILTGALQDNKRAVIMGKRTYGKGLVQNLFPLADSLTAIKLTTARYYTPSGRCIQRSYEEGVDVYNNEYTAILANNGVLPDSLKKNKNIDWGIIPDRFIPADTTAVNTLFNQLYYRYYISEVASSYYANNTNRFAVFKNIDDFNKNYYPDDALFEKFRKYVAEKENAADNYYPKLNYSDTDLNNARSKSEIALKAHILQLKWGDEGFYPLMNSIDDDVKAALVELYEKKKP
ncbi:MAG: S41 family peptidase [Chitinophagales bacterium]|nr:S41 family peptidase [Chitinophagales bacterium]